VSGGRPAVGVLALQGDVAEHLAALAAAGADPVAVRRPQQLAAVAGLVIPGGESTAMWKLAAGCGLAGPLADRVAGGLPVFGSCAGMILLAARLADGAAGAAGQGTIGGIDMTVRRNAFGRQAQSFETSLQVAGVPGGPLTAVFIRSPWVEQHGPAVQVLASEPRTGKAVAVRQGPALATAFHPELTPDRRLHQMFVEMVRERS
jgi:pyridoxal 5'-phosphate synthase pdxT subunit